MKRRNATAILVGSVLSIAACAFAAPIPNQKDTFQDGTLNGWTGGDVLTNVSTGGPAGSGDRYLRMESDGGGSFGGALASYNLDSRWLGNYQAAGIYNIGVDLRAPNTNTTSPLSIRIVLFGPLGSRWTSTTPFALTANGAWQHATFSLDASKLTPVVAGDTYSAMITGVSRIMFRHAVTTSGGGGTVYAGEMGVDNVTAVPPLAGDATGDGKVNGDDYVRIDAGYSANATGYNNGDFTYDGKINADDYFLIDRSYARGGIALGAAAGAESINAVPEPASALGISILCAAMGLRRSRR